jgi:hypothetical protein
MKVLGTDEGIFNLANKFDYSNPLEIYFEGKVHSLQFKILPGSYCKG